MQVSEDIPSGDDGFVIYWPDETTRPQQETTLERQDAAPERHYPDHVLEKNAQVEYQDGFFIGPIYRGGERTGEFRAYRRGLGGRYEMGTFASCDEAVRWAKRKE